VPIPETLQPLTTIVDFVRWGSSEFARRQLVFGHGFESARDEARYLVLHALALPFDWPDEFFAAALTLAEREQVLELLQARIETRRPAAYLTGESWFCGLRFKVDERVLVPRSPIAELIGNRFEPWIDSGRVSRILDLCTGSGCIAIAAQYQFPDAQVAASDISGAALEVAADNLELHRLDDHIELYESDLFASIPERRFDVIVCNPPYVDAEDMAALDEEFSHEPELGLRAGQDGLAVVNRILAEAGDYLDDDGVIFIEVGNSAAALQQKYEFLPLVWIEFEFGGGGVCCINARDLLRQRDAITALAS
jgi:ribosomal protein L3 glutamine methyltransferase